MTLAEMVAAGDIVEFRAYLGTLSDREVMSLWCRNWSYLTAFRNAVDKETAKRRLLVALKP